ncbi:conserved exported protein of unknown function [Streptomyces ambofaciens ATCC 23877]|uniref:Lipoprotein n=1 Tax=Streptomyces ambofaciens (strain ATCC 23877 / 3486 / DSM 40053 / JCM 4204 / NBRC 12836 / NRRL B-2516) TaxID=278992 RepID=A0A0K2AWW6_STRA7|nr:hypothetical protein [Streptomyces ambofaciens]AKZ57396.1 conserved exported protein of unknown function [Streptomyces ambofaciens ATCC 23877]
MNRATPAALATLSLLSLTALTACGGTGDSGSGAAPATTAPSTKEPTAAERLARTMVTTSDVKGLRVAEPDDEFRFARTPDEVTLDKPVCAPLAHAMNQLPLGAPEADLTRVVSGQRDTGTETETANGIGFTYITLTAHRSGDAQSAFAGVRKAVGSCGGGFTAEANGAKTPYDSVTAEKVTPAGDESLGFKATMTSLGVPHVLHTEVVRSGDLLAVHFSVDGLAIANRRPSDAKLSPTVVNAQKAKLG